MLHPAFLLASAVNDDGCIELPAASGTARYPIANAYFSSDARGNFVQRVAPRGARPGEWEPLDMAFFARCLGLALGALTPDLFALRGVGGPGQPRGRLLYTDRASEDARMAVLRSAFLVHLAAYESRLV